MDLSEKLQNKQYGQIWEQYCGFIDLSMSQYMDIQNRLMLEQIALYADCELGRRIMKGKKPTSVSEFRAIVPLTRYEDYADLLLSKVESALPAKPLLWIETTWEGAKNPIKVAPYTEGMVRNYSNSILAIIILATSSARGQFSLRGGENFLYGMAPLPYLTGLIPHLVSEQFPVNFMPPIEDAEKLGFRERSKLGFNMGIQKGVDLFFGLSSIVAKMGETFASGNSSAGFNLIKNTPTMNKRLIKAWINSKQDGTPIRPKDIWTLKGLACTGTDTPGLKKKIEEYWGVRPLELFGGTESGCIATETWNKDGLVFYPDVDFYEFIPKTEIDKNMENPSYIPNTYLLNELLPDNEYELVISNFKGGAFMRYRTGDMFRCISLVNEVDGITLPQFTYMDRYPTIIDIAGFTRIIEDTINEAINISKLDIEQWFAVKDMDNLRRSYVHLYVEIGQNGMRSGLTQDIIKEHLSIYFRHIDSDFKDLKALLGIDPLKITILPRGTTNKFLDTFGRNIRKMNPSHYDVIEILKIAGPGARKEVS
jgi:hypothetical protein